MRSVLLIGGAGYIGSVVADKLLSQGYSVRVLDSLLYGNSISPLALSSNSRYEFLNGDMGNHADLDLAMADITDVVVLAGLVGDPICKAYPSEASLVNEQALTRALDRISQQNLISAILISTCSNYGLIPESDRASETYPLAPLSSYAKAKVQAERVFFDLMRSGQVEKPVVLRFATAFGLSPRMRFDLTVNEFTRSLFAGENVEVFDPDTWRPYCHVSDFAELIESVLQADSRRVAFEVFNAGGDANNHTKRDIIDIILQHNLAGRVEFVSGGNDARNYRVDFSKVRDVFGFEPKVTVSLGVEEILQALSLGFFQDGAFSVGPLGNYELVGNLKGE